MQSSDAVQTLVYAVQTVVYSSGFKDRAAVVGDMVVVEVEVEVSTDARFCPSLVSRSLSLFLCQILFQQVLWITLLYKRIVCTAAALMMR